MKSSNPYLRPKMVFLASETLLSLLDKWKKTFSSTLNVMILQMVKSECVRFGGHIGIQVSYKILQVEVLKESSILNTSPCSQYGLF
jgi:hypothetical protein